MRLESQSLVYLSVLSTMLLETLDRANEPFASDEFVAELREISKRARGELEAAKHARK
jgi:hypothetical protein